MQLEEKISELVDSFLQETKDLFVIDIIIKGKAPMQKVLLLLDGDEGVSIEQCASVSRQLSAKLEELDLFDNPYQIEVSSAGLDSPLKLLRQYKKNVGRNLKITLTDDSVLEGELVAVDSNEVALQLKKTKKEKEPPLKKVAFSEIKTTFVTVSFK